MGREGLSQCPSQASRPLQTVPLRKQERGPFAEAGEGSFVPLSKVKGSGLPASPSITNLLFSLSSSAFHVMNTWTELCCFNTLFLKKMLLFYFCHSFYILISDFFSDKENESYDHHLGVVHVAKEELGRGKEKI